MVDVSSKELYEFKKILKELKEKKGKGTELVSMYVPPDKQLSDITKQMRDELGQSANIKSKTTRKNVQSAIEVISQRWKPWFSNRLKKFRPIGTSVTAHSSSNLWKT